MDPYYRRSFMNVHIYFSGNCRRSGRVQFANFLIIKLTNEVLILLSKRFISPIEASCAGYHGNTSSIN